MMRVIFLFVAGLWWPLAAYSADRQVSVFAAASLSGVLEEIAAEANTNVLFSYGGSGTIARQVAAGAPADLVILATPVWMDWLVSEGNIGVNASQVIAGNTLVVIGAKGAAPLKHPDDLVDRLGDSRLTMGQRDAVPAGAYAREWLQGAGLWTALAPKLAETDNVRAALSLVARGDLPFGVVYASDAQAETRVSVVYIVPAGDHTPVAYPAAALTKQGQGFLAHLTTPRARQILAAHGFAKAPE